MADDGKATALRAELVELGVSTETLAACDDADALTAALPGALSAAFTATEQDFSSHSQASVTLCSPASLCAGAPLDAQIVACWSADVFISECGQVASQKLLEGAPNSSGQ